MQIENKKNFENFYIKIFRFVHKFIGNFTKIGISKEGFVSLFSGCMCWFREFIWIVVYRQNVPGCVCMGVFYWAHLLECMWVRVLGSVYVLYCVVNPSGFSSFLHIQTTHTFTCTYSLIVITHKWLFCVRAL